MLILWVERLSAESVAVPDYFELKLTQRLYGRPFVYSDDSVVVLNVKKGARVGQKMALAHCH